VEDNEPTMKRPTIPCLIFFFLVGTLSAQGIKVVHPQGMEGLAQRIRRVYPALLQDTETRLELQYQKTVEVELTRDHEHFNTAVQRLGGLQRPAHVAAVAFPWRDHIVLQADAWRQSDVGAFRRTFQHEIVHCVLGAHERKAERALPTWVHEGVAQWVSGGLRLAETSTLENALRAQDLMAFQDLVNDFPDQEGASRLAYAQSESLIRFLDGRGQPGQSRNVPLFLRLLLRGETVDRALGLVTGLGTRRFEDAWRQDLKGRFTFGTRHLPEFFFSGTLLTLLALLFATWRVRVRRWKERWEKEEAAEDAWRRAMGGEETPPSSP